MRVPTRFLTGVFTGVALCGLAAAQGSDLCASAQVISGTGSFAFDNSAAATDGVADSLCYFFGQGDIDNDVWFEWTASADGLMSVDTCGQTTMDSKIAIYDGGCGGVVLACNDDSCGLQSQVDFNATNGATYIIRLGNFPGATGGTGTMTISDHLPIQNPANGHFYQAIAAQGLLWNDAKLAAEAMTYNGLSGHLATVEDAAEDAWIWANMNVSGAVGAEELWLGGYQDTGSPNYSEPSGGWTWVTGEAWSYENWGPGEPNDSPAPENFLIYLPNSSPGLWNDAQENHWNIRGYIVEFDGGGTLGTNFCVSVPNSTLGSAEISATGSTSVAANDLTLSSEPQPVGQPGIFYYGPNQVLLSFGNGFRCVGGGSTGIARLGVTSANASNVMSWTVDLTNPPTFQTQILAGSTWNFQSWFRDPAAGGSAFNLSNGLEISFTP